jgi:cathepsin A (carboxypeptidase C)
VNLANSADIFLGEKQTPGFVKLNATDDMFYWLFESRDNVAEDPLVVWLTGGPGCSSEVAIFAENGPFSVKEDLSLLRNDFSWNNKANVLYVDQPVGTGFSKAADQDYTKSETEVAIDFRLFLLGFLDKHPELKGRELFITGESYAGHYIPAISAYLHKQ